MFLNNAEREHDFQHLEASERPLGGFFGPLEGLLGAFVGILRCLGGVLAPSWEACWLLGGPEGENVDFSLVL